MSDYLQIVRKATARANAAHWPVTPEALEQARAVYREICALGPGPGATKAARKAFGRIERQYKQSLHRAMRRLKS